MQHKEPTVNAMAAVTPRASVASSTVPGPSPGVGGGGGVGGSGPSPPGSAASSAPVTHGTLQSIGVVKGGGGGGGGGVVHQHEMSVVLLHKPRGSKGVWYPIAQGDHIRVTKGKGKRLKLEVRTNVELSQDVNVFLVVDGGCLMPAGADSGLLVETIRSVPASSQQQSQQSPLSNSLELSLKLSRLSRRISILVRSTTKDVSPLEMLEARTIEFSAHNNGKERYDDIITALHMITLLIYKKQLYPHPPSK